MKKDEQIFVNKILKKQERKTEKSIEKRKVFGKIAL